MIDLIEQLRKLTEKWRLTGQQARDASVDIPNLLARGHLHGVGDGLDIASDDVDRLLDKSDAPVAPVDDKQ